VPLICGSYVRNPYKTHTGIENEGTKVFNKRSKLQKENVWNRCSTAVPDAKTRQETTGENMLGRIGKDEVGSSNLPSSSKNPLKSVDFGGFCFVVRTFLAG